MRRRKPSSIAASGIQGADQSAPFLSVRATPVRFWGAILLLAGTAPAVFAQAAAPDYPVKFVRFIVPYAPGGSSDVLARTLGQKLGASLGQTFVVDNRPGAGSMVGTDIAAKANADGYTIILSDMPHTINPSIYAKVPYDPVKDFAPITTVGVSPMFLFVNPAVKAQNVKEFVALAKTQPGKLSSHPAAPARRRI